MAERYAPLRNAGGTFITEVRCVKISRTLIKSRAVKPACVRAERHTSGTTWLTAISGFEE